MAHIEKEFQVTQKSWVYVCDNCGLEILSHDIGSLPETWFIIRQNTKFQVLEDSHKEFCTYDCLERYVLRQAITKNLSLPEG